MKTLSGSVIKNNEQLFENLLDGYRKLIRLYWIFQEIDSDLQSHIRKGTLTI